MRRYDKKKNIERLNKSMNESFHTPASPSQEEVDKEIKGFGQEDEVSETSPERALGAANKLYQNKIGGDENDNERAQKLLKTYGEKLKGVSLFNGQINHIDVKLIRNQKDSKNEHAVSQLVVFIGNDMNNAIFYNYSIDQFMDGPTFETVAPLSRPITKAHARELYKIAAHFNPKTRYVNYTRELNIKVEEGVSLEEDYDEDRNDYDYEQGSPFYDFSSIEDDNMVKEGTLSMFEKLCGVRILKESIHDNPITSNTRTRGFYLTKEEDDKLSEHIRYVRVELDRGWKEYRTREQQDEVDPLQTRFGRIETSNLHGDGAVLIDHCDEETVKSLEEFFGRKLREITKDSHRRDGGEMSEAVDNDTYF